MTLGRDSGMNRIGAVVALLLLLALALAFHASGGRTATLQWDYDYVKDPPCNGATAPNSPGKGCVIGFNVFVGTPTNRSDQQFVPNRFDQNGHIINKAISVTMPVHHYGNIQFCVVSVARGQKGQTVESLTRCSTHLVLPFGIGNK